MPAKIIAITNQKGGVGKTTTAVNLSCALGGLGKKVLLVDIDPQSNATSGLGVNAPAGASVYELLLGEIPLQQALLEEVAENVAVVPSSTRLTGAEIELVSMKERETRLRLALKGARRGREYIFIDCPPSLGLMTLNAFTAADGVLIPIQCEYYALEGVGHLLDNINRIRRSLNKRLSISGVLLTMMDARTNLSLQVAEHVREVFGDKVFKTTVPRNVQLSEAPGFGQDIFSYAKKSKGGEAYLELAKEMIERT